MKPFSNVTNYEKGKEKTDEILHGCPNKQHFV